jgi:hypothetical protein
MSKYYEIGVKVELHLKVVKRCMVKKHTPEIEKQVFVKAWERDITDNIILTKGEAYKELDLTNDIDATLRDIGDQAIFDMDDVRDHESKKIEKEFKKIVNLIVSQDN